MTKKRLSDLLKEEVNKDAEPAADAPESTDATVSATPQAKTTRPASRRTTGRRSAAVTTPPAAKAGAASAQAAKAKAAETKAAEAKTTEAKATEPAPVESPTERPNQDAKVTELEQALQAIQDREAALQKQVSGLQADLSNHQERLFELKDLMEKARAEADSKTAQLTQVTAELEEAKQVILKLSEAKPAAKAKPHLVYGAGADIVERRPMSARPAALDSRPPLSQAIQPAMVQNSMLSNDDIGWVD